MAREQSAVDSDLRKELVESYAINERVNQIVLEHLDPRAWRAEAAGGGVRTIAAVFSHVHNVRRKWLRLSAPHLKLPPSLHRAHCSQAEVGVALAESADGCLEMLAEALVEPAGRVQSFHRDGWARPWPAGAAMAVYMISHEAHHRGQVCMLAHQLGYPLPVTASSGIWAWERL